MANEAIVYKKYTHIGVAVDTPNGLLVPVIRDVDRKTIGEIAADLATLSQKARDRKLSLDEMSGGVLSVTNLGGIGGTSFTPIVNQPEVAILGLSRTATEPVFRDGQFVPRQMLPLSLSYDHRVIDGADAARFLRFVAEALEQPLSMHL
jgi:pyruvate dehydrogenase E2 component (dihydrolipoamide acetyltransferase)